MSSKHKHPRPHALSTAQRGLIEDIRAGGILRRRGRGPDQNYFLGGRKAYTRLPRSVADALVRHGLARWAPCADPRLELATHYLVLEAL